MNFQIASTTEEQGAVSEEINPNVNNISAAAEQNATRSQETQTTMDQLSECSNKLQILVAQFRRT